MYVCVLILPNKHQSTNQSDQNHHFLRPRNKQASKEVIHESKKEGKDQESI